MSVMFIPVGPLALPEKISDSSSEMNLPCRTGAQATDKVGDVELGASVVATHVKSPDYSSAAPNEVLLLIFSFLFGSTSAEDIRDQIYNASAVCKLWDALIKHTPHFWTTLPKLRSANGMTYNQTASLPYTYDEEEDKSQAPDGLIWSCACNCFEGRGASTENDTGSSGEDMNSGEELGMLGEGLDSEDEPDDSEDESESSEYEEDSEDDEQTSDSDEEEHIEHEYVQESFLPQVKNSLFSSYLHIILKYLVRSYPLPVEAHLCLPPDEIVICRDCGTLELMMYTVLHVLQRAKTVSLDVHTSSVRLLKTILRCEPSCEKSYLPDVVRMMTDVNNLTMPPRDEPEYKKQCCFPYLEDLSVILSHSAKPEEDAHSAYSLVNSLFKGIILKHFAVVNAIRVVPQMHIPWREPLILTTDLFHKGTWSSLTTFRGAFTGLGDIRVVLAAARNLEEALFIVHLKDEQNIFPIREMAAMERAIDGMGMSDSEDDIAMPYLRSLIIKISGDSFSSVDEPPHEDNGDHQLQSDGPGKDLFRFILKGVQFPALQALTLSAAFLLFSVSEPHISDESSEDLEDFFESCQSSLYSLTLDEMPIGISGKTPYISTVKIPSFYLNLFEALQSTPSLQRLIVHEPVPFDQFENISEVLQGVTQVSIYGTSTALFLPDSLQKIEMALRYRGMNPYLLHQDYSLVDILRAMALQESCDDQEQEWIGYSSLTPEA